MNEQSKLVKDMVEAMKNFGLEVDDDQAAMLLDWKYWPDALPIPDNFSHLIKMAVFENEMNADEEKPAPFRTDIHGDKKSGEKAIMDLFKA